MAPDVIDAHKNRMKVLSDISSPHFYWRQLKVVICGPPKGGKSYLSAKLRNVAFNSANVPDTELQVYNLEHRLKSNKAINLALYDLCTTNNMTLEENLKLTPPPFVQRKIVSIHRIKCLFRIKQSS